MEAKDLRCAEYPACACDVDEVCNAESRLNRAYQRGLADGREQGRAEERAKIVEALGTYHTVRIDVCSDGRCLLWLVSGISEAKTVASVSAALARIMEGPR